MNFKRIFALTLAVLMLSCTLAACGDQPQNTQPGTTTGAEQSANADYKVTVVDALGKPYTAGVIVRFLKGAEQVAMQVVDENGAVTKNLERGEYTVELMFTDDKKTYVYDQESLKLTAQQTTLEVSVAVALSGENTLLYQNNGQVPAYHAGVCSNFVELIPGQRNYFLFIPREAGTYEIQAVGAVEGIGYYGSPHYMSDNTMAEVVDGVITMSIRADMIGSGEGGTSVMVIGIDPGSAADCILSIQRTGDPAWSPEDVPYVIYQGTHNPTPYTLPEGKAMLDFDLTVATDHYKLVLDQNGYYHLNDENGPLVLVKLGVDNQYTPSFATMMTKTGIRAYFYDDNGTFLRREDYFECLVKYTGHTNTNSGSAVVTEGAMDAEAGVYPLTEDLKYIIQNHGNHSGWYDLDRETSIFRDKDGEKIQSINPEIAWLFMCCYLAQ